MNRFPAPDLAGALRLTQQGRLKEAMDILRGKTANGKLPDPRRHSPQPRKTRGFPLIPDVLKARLGEDCATRCLAEFQATGQLC